MHTSALNDSTGLRIHRSAIAHSKSARETTPESPEAENPGAVDALDQRVEHAPRARGELSFGQFRLFPSKFLLLDRGRPVRIGSRALEILAVLLERPGELISREELMARVWPNIFVELANLTVHISALRRALHDGQRGNRFIINVPGRGYSFVASVEKLSTQS